MTWLPPPMQKPLPSQASAGWKKPPAQMASMPQGVPAGAGGLTQSPVTGSVSPSR
jgi:hypothetical protein